MKRRFTIPAALLLGCVLVVAALEMTGRLGGSTGAATGTDNRGCAGPEVPLPEARPADIMVGIPIAVPDDRRAGPADRWVDAIPGRYVVALASPDAGLGDDVLDVLGVRELRPLFPGVKGRAVSHLALDRTLQFEAAAPYDEVAAELEQLDEVAWVEPLIRVRAAALPNDPYYGFQWHMQALDVHVAWDVADGADTIVAVVDSGVSVGSDGLTDLLPGYDFVDDDADPSDLNGHGTHVAGTVAQATDNATGVVGVARDASILPVRVLDADGSGTSSDVAAGIIYAVDNGAQVINLSLGSGSPSMVIEEACAYAEEADVLVVAATGNEGYADFVGYPAAFSTTVAVGATDVNHDITYYSNQGEQVDIVAPGGDLSVDANGDGYPDGVLQETIVGGNWGYYLFSGTSMATPHVAGTAALMVSNGVTDVADLRDGLLSTADDLGAPGEDDAYGHGLLAPTAALGYAAPVQPAPFDIIGLQTRDVGAGRVIARWLTVEAATTTADGANGHNFADQTETNVHRAFLRGAPGSTVDFTFLSTSADGFTASETREVTFPFGGGGSN